MQHPSKIGKYEIEEFLGGGMSRVYRAKDTALGRRVALKMMSEAAAANQDATARFLQEARLASSISHPNIISVLDYGDEAGTPYMVMELLEGESLRQAMDQNHVGDVGRRLRVALQLGRALEHIHTRKIIHRDVKPDNVNVDRTGGVKLMDFGIAKAHDVQLTRVGFTLGTPFYMAPEQIRGGAITAQTDVYSFGVLLYELLSGKKPFEGGSYDKVFDQSLNQTPDLAPLRAAGVPPAAIDLISQTMSKLPAVRPQGMGAVCTEIERILTAAAKPSPAPPPSIHKLSTAAIAKMDLPPLLAALPAPLQSSAGLMLLSAIFVLVLAGGIIMILRTTGAL